MPLEAVIAALPSAETQGTTICFWSMKALYVFGNIPEQYQRIATQMKGVPWSRKNQHIFLSGQSSLEKNGGLPGMLLTLASASDQTTTLNAEHNVAREKQGKHKLDDSIFDIPIHGSENLAHQLASLRLMIMRQSMRIRIHETRSGDYAEDRVGPRKPDWEDILLQVWKVPVQRAAPTGSPWKRLAEDNGDEANSPPRKVRSKPCSPQVAKWIVEESMFDGRLDSSKNNYLVGRRAGTLEEGEQAFYRESPDHPLRLYTHRPAEVGALDDDAAVYVPLKGWHEKKKLDGAIDVHHHPLPPTTYSGLSLSYIIKSRPQRGRFLPAVAIDLGVAKKQFSALTSGQSVTTAEGKTVTPEMVLGPPVKGLGAVIADIATADLVEPFLQQPEWQDEELTDGLSIVYWLLGRGLSSHPRLLEFMRARPHMEHVICAPDTAPNTTVHLGSDECVRAARQVDPDRFPPHKATPEPEVTEPSDKHIYFADKYLAHMIMPTFKRWEERGNASGESHVAHIQKIAAEESAQVTAQLHPDMELLAIKAAALANDPKYLAQIEEQETDIPSRDAEIIPLGTSSSQPTSSRNVCGTLITVPNVGNYILDAGEGTIGQIRRLYGLEDASYGQRTAEILRDLKAIVVSHVHADHLIGLVNLVKAWYQQALRDSRPGDRLAIICIPRVRQMLEEMAQMEDIGFHRLVFPGATNVTGLVHTTDATRCPILSERPELGLSQIKRVRIEHCWESYGTELTLSSGLRIAWSGDCRPSTVFADACRGAHLLVHECTFAPDEAAHARAKGHCTADEAVQVAERMQARRTLFTHFSARYSDSGRKFAMARETQMPWYQEKTNGEKKYLAALDLKVIKLGDWQRAACFAKVEDIVWAMQRGWSDKRLIAELGETLDRARRILHGGEAESPAGSPGVNSRSPSRASRPESPRRSSRTPPRAGAEEDDPVAQAIANARAN